MKTEVRTLADGKAGLVLFDGEIDFSVLDEIRTALDEAIGSNPACVLIDLSAVTFIASDGLGVLIETQRKADSDGRKLALIHPQPHILGMLRKTQLTRLFKVFESIDEALQDLI